MVFVRAGKLGAATDGGAALAGEAHAAGAQGANAQASEVHPTDPQALIAHASHGDASQHVAAQLEVAKKQETVRDAAAVATAVVVADSSVSNDKATLLHAAHNSAIANAGAAAGGVAVTAGSITTGTVTAGAQTLANAGLGQGGLEQAAEHQSEARQQIQEVAAVNMQATEDLRALADAPAPPQAPKRVWGPTPRLPRWYDKPLYSDRLMYDPIGPKIDRKKLEYKFSRAQALNRTEFMGRRVFQSTDEEANDPRFRLKFSSHECVGILFEHRVCTFYDTVVWAGRVYYIARDPEATARSIPEVQMAYISKEPYRLSSNLTQRVVVVSPANFTARLAEEGYGFEWASVPKMEVDQNLMINLAYWTNYGHSLGEMGPMVHNLMCTYMRLCTWEEVNSTDLQLWLYNELPTIERTMVRAAREELWPCFSRSPLLRLMDGRLNHTVVLLHRLVAGVGSTCRAFPWCRLRYNRTPPLPGIVLGWKERMHRCLGLPLRRLSNHTHPRVLFVNRPLAHGRAFINMEETLARLREDLPHVTFAEEMLESESLRSQALKYVMSDVVVQMHGAALGNVFFLPRGSVYIDVVPERNEDKHAWAYFMLRDYSALGINPIALPPQRVEFMEYTINKTMRGHLNTLSKQQRVDLFEHHKCPEPGTVFWDVYSICVIEWFMKRSNCYLDYDQLKPAIDQALTHMQLWRHKYESTYLANAYDLIDLQPDRDVLDLV